MSGGSCYKHWEWYIGTTGWISGNGRMSGIIKTRALFASAMGLWASLVVESNKRPVQRDCWHQCYWKGQLGWLMETVLVAIP